MAFRRSDVPIARRVDGEATASHFPRRSASSPLAEPPVIRHPLPVAGPGPTDESERLTRGLHPDYSAEVAASAAALQDRATAEVRAVVVDGAQAAARERDDSHVGTEHIVLALYRTAPNVASDVLTECGISAELFVSVLDDEPGPSPNGPIPYTTRAAMVGALAVAAADRSNSDGVELTHLLQGVVAESRRWSEQHAWGPHHLATAAKTVDSSLDAIEVAIARRSPA